MSHATSEQPAPTPAASRNPPASVAQIESKMFMIRGQKVMLDEDLAALYEVETKALNRAVKRNLERFPADFMFQLSAEEFATLRFQNGTSNLRSQIVTSNEKRAGRGGRRYAPYAFTEQGVAMLSSVLRSERAIQGRHSGESRNPVKKNTPRSGQNEPPAASFEVRPNLGVVPLAWDISIIWIPAFAGMTDFRSNGLFSFKAVFEAIHELMSPPESKKKRPIGFAPWEKK
ncbi:MAG: ORF6N domain-containing protein [Sideroxydans sp.]|nr:ORF6N domain-containing protein [Sideroxydans sp.]